MAAFAALFRGLPTLRASFAIACGAQAASYALSTFGRAEPTEHYYDLSGAATHLLIVAYSVSASGAARGAALGGARAALLGALSTAWAVRLGGYLFDRVSRTGGDARFDALKRDAASWPIPWALQAVWCTALTAPLVVAAGARAAATPLTRGDAAGAALFLAGLALEVAADAHKDAAKRRAPRAPVVDGPFAWCVYANYFGEVALWCGAAALALPAAGGAAGALAALAAPALDAALILCVSGVPLAEARVWKAYGGDAAWVDYRARTPLFFPRPPRAAAAPAELERARARARAAVAE